MNPTLFRPLALRELHLPNRVIVAPMCQYSAQDGSATDWHVMHLGTMTQGGAALTLIEATGVSPEGRITPDCLGLWSDENEAALARVLAAIRPHAKGAIGIQLAHAGRKASSAPPWKGGQLITPQDGGWTPWAPSAVRQRPEEAPPHAMSEADIHTVIAQFAKAAERAQRLGLDVIEMHSAHGYLMHQFLSPISNQRTDEWGGSLENRMRLPLAVFDAMRAVWPAHKPLGVRVSATDWMEHSGVPSWTLEQTVDYAKALKAHGCDFIDVSSGGITSQQQIKLGAGYQVPFARAVREATGLPTMAVGLITEPAQAEQILVDGDADMVALARGMLWNPRWVWHAAAELGGQVTPPPQYGRSAPRGHADVLAGVPFGGR
ncbi:NADH:flavin oxidoreductase/NADH oxidase [Rhizobacter sp. OV335]|uniref:NADH:flavin oxidoreductase/NADH oxidase n=1 Tax=Rhizobacter sp. OV335 TaxID=1500264 RepID=UPI00092463BC|nr:NADH:flavin oxidoreductase/NADH oxidase [Rhizobacter sp. OV335]SHM83451.1 2,4-dienoyl-CoA reductase [Rhizobacter sp. OV335]